VNAALSPLLAHPDEACRAQGMELGDLLEWEALDVGSRLLLLTEAALTVLGPRRRAVLGSGGWSTGNYRAWARESARLKRRERAWMRLLRATTPAFSAEDYAALRPYAAGLFRPAWLENCRLMKQDSLRLCVNTREDAEWIGVAWDLRPPRNGRCRLVFLWPNLEIPF
jgi:hypothetical protein